MNENELETVRKTAEDFLAKMASWERRSLKWVQSGETNMDEVRAELREIFDAHLTKKAASRKQLRYELQGFQDPPYFEQTITAIEAADDGGYWIEMPEDMFGKVRLHFVNENGEWKIDFKKSEVDDGVWKKTLDI